MTHHTTTDPTLDRQLRHMAWANQALIAKLATEPDNTLALTAPKNEWSAGRILGHLVNAAENYARRLEGGSRSEGAEQPTTAAQLPALGERLAAIDARIREQAALPEGMAGYAGGDNWFPRSTVLAQAIHHATEHRAQIAGALSTNGNNALDLDAIDFWEFTEQEGGAIVPG